jgi:hypothetical protein
VGALQGGERLSPAVAGVDVEDYQIGDRSGDDADIGVRPSSPPSLDLLDAGGIHHAFLPRAVRVLARCRAVRITA